MKKYFTLLILTITGITSFAAHITGGEMYYTFVGMNGSEYQYTVTLKLYRKCGNQGAALDAAAPIAIFNNANNSMVWNNKVQMTSSTILQLGSPDPCIQNPPTVCYEVGFYTFTVSLPASSKGYTISYQRCCRIAGINNLINSGNVGSTYTAIIPGTGSVSTAPGNNSAKFIGADTVIVCANNYFQYNFGAVDADPEDSLVYSFCSAYSGGGTAQTPAGGPNTPSPDPPTAPPYSFVPYSTPFSDDSPLGSGVTINSSTGLVSGIAPAAGTYVVTVCVAEYRNGVLIATQRKDLQISVGDCDAIQAALNPEYISCDGFDQTFSNNASSTGINSYFWDFGVPGRNDDTSNVAMPTWNYAPDTGVYTIKLVVNRGQACADSTTAIVRVFPGFFPDFDIVGICATKPTQFRDRTATNYGVVNTWRWDFGDPATNADTSRLQNPTYTYPTPGSYNVRFIVTNSKGCIDTLPRTIQILDKPPLSVRFDDTLICRGDQLQLEALGTGNFSWTPAGSIVSGANTATPVVNPTATTSYIVQLDDNGCLNWDTVKVNVVNFVTLQGMPDTTICETDSVQLKIVSDGLSFAWTPAASLNNPKIKNPTALPPAGTTNYTVTATIGGCSETADIAVTTVPYPVANAGPPVEICYNTSAQINASTTGSSFTWSPTTGLNNPNILNPVAAPAKTTAYILTVTDDAGCPKPTRDTIVVTVRPQLQVSAGRDTAVVVGQPLQLQATGGTKYIWTPSIGLNNPNIANPKGTYDGSFEYITYKVYIEDNFPCRDSASVTVRVFKTNPQIFVPTAFTPNGDRKNDRFTFVPVGISKIDYFRVYNRWGQLVYSAVSPYPGWDGKIGGKEQGSGVFVWIVKGSDFTGKVVTAKGTVTLIR